MNAMGYSNSSMRVTWPNCEQLQQSDGTSLHLLLTLKKFQPLLVFTCFAARQIAVSIFVKYSEWQRRNAVSASEC